MYQILTKTPADYWPFWLVGLGGVVLVFVGLLAVFWLPKIEERRKDEFPPEAPQQAPAPEEGPVRTEQVRFVRIGKPAEPCFGTVTTARWTGVGAAGEILLPGKGQHDPKMGREHFYIRLAEGGFLVRPGRRETFVNGVPIRALGDTLMRDGDRLRAGSCEYRLFLEKTARKANSREETRI